MVRTLLLASLGLAPLAAAAPLNVVINNQNSGYPANQVYFSFRAAPVSGTINGQPLAQDQVYSLADIGSGLTLTRFASGRLYFSLGAPLVGTGDPEPINSSVANWGTRFDKIELTYSQTDHSGVANLTSIDYFAIPIGLKTYAGGTATGAPLAALTFRQSGDTVAARLAALSGDDPTVWLHDGQNRFLRVLGPTLAHAGAYPSFQPYITAVRASGQPSRIQGLYSHLPASAATTTQNYDFTATFDSGGNLRLDGGGTSYAGGATVGPGHVVLIRAADLAAGVYSANPDYTVDGAAAHIGDNDVYSAVVRDVLTGFALGFVNSPTLDPSTGVAFKDEASKQWWTSPQAFGFLQSNSTYYDQYAAYLQTISGAYGYPFSDVWQVVQVSLDPATVNTLEIDVLPDIPVPALTLTGISRSATGAVHLTGQGVPGGTVYIQASPTLTAPNWTTLGTVTPGADGGLGYDDQNAAGTQKFYRLTTP